MFGRTARLFSRGQRALARRDFATAEKLLREALAGAPRRFHVHVHLARALAEQDHRDEAERVLAAAAELAPASFVVPLELGILRLDAGEPARAREPLDTAARLAPANRLVAGYVALARWIQHGGPPTARLAELAGELPESFGARVLLRLAETTLAARGGRAAVALLDAPESVPLPLALRLGALRYRDRLDYAERLLARGRFEDAAWFVAAHPELMTDARAPAVLQRARQGALRALDEALAACAPGRRSALLLQRYEIEHELGDVEAVVRTLTEWHEAYETAGAPAAQRHLAAAVLRRLAAAEVERGRYEAALGFCAASRAARAERETAGVEGLARLGLGRRRAARHAFEDFLNRALFPLARRLREAAADSTA